MSAADPPGPPSRRPRLAMLLIRGLDHFAQDLLARLPAAAGFEVRGFLVAGAEDLAAALAWTDRPETDALWFEFCWPPFPHLIAKTDFGGRRVILRVHRIEAVETPHVAQTDWRKVDDLVVVSPDMARRVRAAAPALDRTAPDWTAPDRTAPDRITRLHVIGNGVDTDRFAPSAGWNPHRIGWCGLMIARKNPVLALHILFNLRLTDPRYELHMCSQGGDGLAGDSFLHLARRLDLLESIHLHGHVAQADMPAWHARNGVLLHTSLHESFGYAIAEAACTGADLCVLDHPGAEDFWPEAVRFGTVDEAVWLIRNAGPLRWRARIVENFSLARQIGETAAMLAAPRRREAA